MPQARKFTISTVIVYILTLPLAIVIWLGAGGCTSKPTAKETSSNSGSTSVDISVQHVSWLTPESMTPLEFLGTMKQGDNYDPLEVVVMLDSFPKNWIKKKDIDNLSKPVNSREKCLCFLNPLSSYIPKDSADLGGYAMKLIESYKQKKKLSFGLYACPKTTKIEAEELINWWSPKADISIISLSRC